MLIFVYVYIHLWLIAQVSLSTRHAACASLYFLCVLCDICICVCVFMFPSVGVCTHVCDAQRPRATVGCVHLIGGGEIEPL